MQCKSSWEFVAEASHHIHDKWSFSHTSLGSGNHLHGDREHTGVGCEGHAGCEHHLLTVTMKGTVIWAPSCRQSKGNVYLLMGFCACGREIVFWVKKGKNPYNYYSLGFEWILKSNPCRNHLSVHRNKTPEEFSGTIAVLSWTLRSAHLAEPPNDNRRGATFSQGLGCQTRSQAVPHWKAWGQVSCYHYCFSICTWLFLFSNYFYIYYYT